MRLDGYAVVRLLERITHSEVEAKIIFELTNVEVGGNACVVGDMDADTEVETQDEEVEVVTDAETCTDSKVFEEFTGSEFSTRMIRVVVHEPHIASIDKEGTLDGVEDGESVFGIKLQFEVARLVEIGATFLFVIIASRPDATNGEGSDAVGSTHIEEFAVRCPI